MDFLTFMNWECHKHYEESFQHIKLFIAVTAKMWVNIAWVKKGFNHNTAPPKIVVQCKVVTNTFVTPGFPDKA